MPEDMLCLEESRLKVDWAKKHLSDLDQRVYTFASNCYTLRIAPDPHTGKEAIYAKVTKPVLPDFALIIGDVLHNLKSALDLAINAVVFARLKERDDYTRFPVRTTRDELASAVKGGVITKASPAVANFIVEWIKPYKGGNDALWTLHRLNILDKHQLLLPVWKFQAISGIRVVDERGQEFPIGTWVITGEREARHTLPAGYNNIKIVDNGEASVGILFKQGLPTRDEAVIPTLYQLSDVVSGVLDGIETAFYGEDTHP